MVIKELVTHTRISLYIPSCAVTLFKALQIMAVYLVMISISFGSTIIYASKIQCILLL